MKKLLLLFVCSGMLTHFDNRNLEARQPANTQAEKLIAGRIAQVDRGRQQIMVQSGNRIILYLDIDRDTRIQIGGRDGTFNDLDVSQPIEATYFTINGRNECRFLKVRK